MKNLFIFRKNIHNIRNFQIVANEKKNTVRSAMESICYMKISIKSLYSLFIVDVKYLQRLSCINYNKLIQIDFIL